MLGERESWIKDLMIELGPQPRMNAEALRLALIETSDLEEVQTEKMKSLMLVVLESWLHVYFGSDQNKMKRAYHWAHISQRMGLFSFSSVCAALELRREDVRAALVRVHNKVHKIEGVSDTSSFLEEKEKDHDSKKD